MSSVDKPITFYTPSNIPLPALTSLAVNQELQDELLIRRLNLAFNRGIEHERKLTNMPMNEASHAACKMVQEDKPDPEYIDVTIRLPKPPDGWGEPEWREMSCKTDVYLSCNLKWNIVGNSSFGGRLFFCRRIWTPPASAVGTFYPHGGDWLLVVTQVSRFDSAELRSIADKLDQLNRVEETKEQA